MDERRILDATSPAGISNAEAGTLVFGNADGAQRAIAATVLGYGGLARIAPSARQAE
jgi:hypothetical protein